MFAYFVCFSCFSFLFFCRSIVLVFRLFPFCCFFGFIAILDFNETDPCFCFSFFSFVVFSGALKSRDFNETDPIFCGFVLFLFVVFLDAFFLGWC